MLTVSPIDNLCSLPTVTPFSLVPVDDYTIIGYLKQINERKATGSDGIPARFVKMCAKVLVKPMHMTSLINMSIVSSTVPSAM